MSHIIAKDLGLEIPHFLQDVPIRQSLYSTLVRAPFSRPRREFRTLLSGLDFKISQGERVAILGRNGAGKTTLLRVLTGAFQPTHGVLDIQGSRQALLNLGLGFNSEATVHENIYLRAIAMGMKSAEIQGMIHPVLEFSELADVANHRLATLSSGQRMRLGFAISTAVQHDIMLLDEWVGTGDAGFVEKAKLRMTSRVDASKIVVLASHNFPLLRKVCTRGIVLDHGRLMYAGEIEDSIKEYKKIYQADPIYIANKSG